MHIWFCLIFTVSFVILTVSLWTCVLFAISWGIWLERKAPFSLTFHRLFLSCGSSYFLSSLWPSSTGAFWGVLVTFTHCYLLSYSALFSGYLVFHLCNFSNPLIKFLWSKKDKRLVSNWMSVHHLTWSQELWKIKRISILLLGPNLMCFPC